MKRLVFVFVVAILLVFNTACTSSVFGPDEFAYMSQVAKTQRMPEISFKTWAESLSVDEVVKLYDSSVSVLSDARSAESISPFSYKDSITNNPVPVIWGKYGQDNNPPGGMTSVYYKKLMIFQKSWDYPFMGAHRSITGIKYGVCFGMKVLKIENESYFLPTLERPNGYSGRENRLFIERGGVLEEVDLEATGVLFAFAEIKMTTRKNVVIFYTTDFTAYYTTGPGRYLILFDLATKESKRYEY